MCVCYTNGGALGFRFGSVRQHRYPGDRFPEDEAVGNLLEAGKGTNTR